MDFVKHIENETCSIILNGRFTFSDNPKFRKILDDFKGGAVRNLVFDFSKVEFVDSAALGMLLIAKDEAEKGNIGLVLRGANGQVEKMFKVSKFDTIFKLS